MAFHVTNFGTYANRLQPYADIDGYVPEVGDSFADFRHDGHPEPEDMGDEGWKQFVADAAEATATAIRDLDRFGGYAFPVI